MMKITEELIVDALIDEFKNIRDLVGCKLPPLW